MHKNICDVCGNLFKVAGSLVNISDGIIHYWEKSACLTFGLQAKFFIIFIKTENVVVTIMSNDMQPMVSQNYLWCMWKSI